MGEPFITPKLGDDEVYTDPDTQRVVCTKHHTPVYANMGKGRYWGCAWCSNEANRDWREVAAEARAEARS